jgi:CRISPR type III-associated protein (TIGR04423 family)
MKIETEIPKGKYQGYLWYSDKSEPNIVDGSNELKEPMNLEKVSNPFIVEGYLYDEANQKSYSIKMVDGKYHAYCSEVPKEKEGADYKVENVTYLPNRMPSKGGLVFKRIWRPKVDALCEGMSVWVPQEELFVGFKNLNEK